MLRYINSVIDDDDNERLTVDGRDLYGEIQRQNEADLQEALDTPVPSTKDVIYPEDFMPAGSFGEDGVEPTQLPMMKQKFMQSPAGGITELPGKLGSEVGQLAMSREQARGLLDNFTKEALRGNITPQAFGDGLFESQAYGVSPDQGRRAIRNTLKNPMARMMAENSGLAKEFARAGLGGLQALGVNPQTANKYLGLGGTLLDQARKDGLLKQDVSVEEVAEHFQRPLYGALQDYIRDNKNNPEIEALLRKAYPDAKMPGRTLLEGLLNELADLPGKLGSEVAQTAGLVDDLRGLGLKARDAVLDAADRPFHEELFIKAHTGGVGGDGVLRELPDSILRTIKKATQKDTKRRNYDSDIDLEKLAASAKDLIANPEKATNPFELQGAKNFLANYENEVARAADPGRSTSGDLDLYTSGNREAHLGLGTIGVYFDKQGNVLIKDKWKVDGSEQGRPTKEDGTPMRYADLAEGGDIASDVHDLAKQLGTYKDIPIEIRLTKEQWDAIQVD